MATRVTVYKATLRKQTVWVVSRREGGKRKRSFLKSKEAANAEASRLRDEINSAGQVWNSLTGPERDEIISAWREAKKKGLDLRRLIADAGNTPANGDGPKLTEVIEELLLAKKNAGRSKDYREALRLVLGQFASGREAMPLAKIGLPEVEGWLNGKTIASRSTLRARLSTLFKFAVRRGYRPDNPCARLEPITAPHRPPAIFTPKQVESALKWLHQNAPRALPWFVLSTFCGLRPEEAEKTRKADIHRKEGWIKVEAQTTKVRQRRVVYPKACAVKLLASVLKRGRLPIHPLARRRVLRRLREHLGFKTWPKDITRHSAASYWLADCESTSAVAKSLGNSESTLLKHYAALVTKVEAREFWKVCG